MNRRINWRSPKTWAVIVGLNIVCSPTVWAMTIALFNHLLGKP